MGQNAFLPFGYKAVDPTGHKKYTQPKDVGTRQLPKEGILTNKLPYVYSWAITLSRDARRV
jgi:hypothetical protein